MALSTSSKRFLGFLVIGGAIIAGGVYATGEFLDPACEEPDNAGEEVAFVIPAGATAGTVGAALEEQRIVCSGEAFRRAARDAGVDSSLVAGEYQMAIGMAEADAVAVLGSGPQATPTFTVTIPEGLTVAQTLERLAAGTPHAEADYRAVLDARLAAGANGDGLLRIPDFVPEVASFGPEVREPFEGLLFPLTYEFVEDATPLDVLQRLVDQLEAVVLDLAPSEVEAFTDAGFRLYDGLVIASLVEREARVGEERETIAGVIRNRLDDGMLLQIDASVLYGQGDPAAGASAVDTSFSSPYNTYENPGLPPTPISGFRASLVRTSIQPSDVDFRFYVVSPDCDGSHNFAVTGAEHEANVAAYRNAGRCEG